MKIMSLYITVLYKKDTKIQKQDIIMDKNFLEKTKDSTKMNKCIKLISNDKSSYYRLAYPQTSWGKLLFVLDTDQHRFTTQYTKEKNEEF